MCILEGALRPLAARMHYTKCHSRSAGSGQGSVGSHNPVNVEQYLIRSTLRQAASPVMMLCMSLSAEAEVRLDSETW